MKRVKENEAQEVTDLEIVKKVPKNILEGALELYGNLCKNSFFNYCDIIFYS